MVQDYGKLSVEEVIKEINYYNQGRVVITSNKLLSICRTAVIKRDSNLNKHLVDLIYSNSDLFFEHCYVDFLKVMYSTYSIEDEIYGVSNILKTEDFCIDLCNRFNIEIIGLAIDYLISDDRVVRNLTVRLFTYMVTTINVDSMFIEKIIECLTVCLVKFDDLSLKKEVARFSNYYTDDNLNKIIDFYLANERDYSLKLLCTLSVSNRNKKIVQANNNLDKLRFLLGIR